MLAIINICFAEFGKPPSYGLMNPRRTSAVNQSDDETVKCVKWPDAAVVAARVVLPFVRFPKARIVDIVFVFEGLTARVRAHSI